jgi:hypothetical protein
MPDPIGLSPPANPFSACAAEVVHLADALEALDRQAGLLQLAPLAGREWYELLHRKLIPQLAGQPFIVAAVVGGTNIGKSVIFNHLAGGRVSATSPLASGTRHPVCLVPMGFEKQHDLAAIFQGFELHEWTDPDAALENCPEHRLFWKTSPGLPANLLVLDSPDIDSDAEINWLRADHLRHCADVLVAVLTQQKYNDAAVKQFFRKAAGEDKAVIIVFNQCLLPEDEEFWPLWLDTFSRETGIVPDLLYLAPNDRRAAEENRLSFLERSWPPDERRARDPMNAAAHNLARDLSEMRFAEIKLRTLRGALGQILSPQVGARAWLEEIGRRSAAFQDAAHLLSMQELARVDNWPSPPVSLLVAHIREWWRTHREGWTKTIHDVYGTVGNGLLWPFRWARNRIAGDAPDPRMAYRTAERNVMLQAVDSLYSELTRLSELGNDLLRPRLESLLAGASRAELLKRLTVAQDALDLDEELNTVVSAQMQVFRNENPNAFRTFRKIDSMAAAARPVTSVVFFAVGAGADVFSHVAANATTQFIVAHIATGTGAVVAGEAALSGTAGGLRLLETRFRQLQAAFTTRRVAWFANFLRENILGGLHDELAAAAGLTAIAPYRDVVASLDRLERQIKTGSL